MKSGPRRAKKHNDSSTRARQNLSRTRVVTNRSCCREIAEHATTGVPRAQRGRRPRSPSAPRANLVPLGPERWASRPSRCPSGVSRLLTLRPYRTLPLRSLLEGPMNPRSARARGLLNRSQEHRSERFLAASYRHLSNADKRRLVAIEPQVVTHGPI
jgi:hypothetical protein